ncbi:CPBP family intramembrane glutamic endopeptidase [Caldisericum exile]|uniref:Hypothetical membrane protein n=1 Tax=Caldisericum exile (strain DSM 21853 / NBRC 104410 / AZM16c01) TaxID=511051 RepID=A0A7U6GD87_CALEA|nr:CPBP family intramembrane glutamic endopeptidase [Caldisericum exile]BAL80244.1 hypothetical membrane protein [Caldisericum exile AZM16c01]
MEEKESKNKFQLIALWLIVASWILRGLTTGEFLDVSGLLFLIAIFLYKLIGKYNPTEVLKIGGIKRAKITTLLLYVLGTILISFVLCSWILPKILNVDGNRIAQLSRSFLEAGKSKKYPKPIAMINLLNYFLYGTFMEEFIFRGLILRRLLLKYHSNVANIIQAVIFGSAHLLGVMSMPTNYKIFMFISPTICGLMLGYAYIKTDNNLTIPWIAHYLVNTIPLIVYFIFGMIMVA